MLMIRNAPLEVAQRTYQVRWLPPSDTFSSPWRPLHSSARMGLWHPDCLPFFARHLMEDKNLVVDLERAVQESRHRCQVENGLMHEEEEMLIRGFGLVVGDDPNHRRFADLVRCLDYVVSERAMQQAEDMDTEEDEDANPRACKRRR